MKKFSVLLALVIALGGNLARAAESDGPSLLFSDLTSGPATGGRDDQGAFVTVVGRNFGARQGGGYVTVGGVKAAAYPVWTDTRISFQLGSGALSGGIKVVTAGGTSNSLPFAVRSGRIFFVDDNGPGNPGRGTFADPWRNPSSFVGSMKPGDILYYREGTYGGTVLGSGQANGAAGNEIAFAGYPGETAKISATPDFDFQDNRQYFVIAGFKLYSTGRNISITASHVRVVNNDIEGLKSHTYGMIHPTIGNDMKIYGNTFSGATSGNKLDHPIYVGYGADNVDIGWNKIFNNKIDRGPVISINTDGAQQAGYKFENIRIHDNDIDCSGARGIALVCMQAGSTVYIYNNIFTGDSPNETIYMYSGSLYLYNNVFYGSPGSKTVQLIPMSDGTYTYRPETVKIENNIFYNRNGAPYFEISGEDQMGSVTVSNNAYYGAGAGPARDAKAINGDPLFVNAAGGDFTLRSNSPCVNAGADISDLFPFDKWGYPRPQGGGVDMGPYEYAVNRNVSDSGTADGDPGVLLTDTGSGIRVSDLLVLGSAAGRGTVNPDKGESAKILFRGRETGTYHVRIFTLAGELAWEKTLLNVREGICEWLPRGMASAVYVVNVQGPGLKATRKLAVLR